MVHVNEAAGARDRASHHGIDDAAGKGAIDVRNRANDNHARSAHVAHHRPCKVIRRRCAAHKDSHTGCKGEASRNRQAHASTGHRPNSRASSSPGEVGHSGNITRHPIAHRRQAKSRVLETVPNDNGVGVAGRIRAIHVSVDCARAATNGRHEDALGLCEVVHQIADPRIRGQRGIEADALEHYAIPLADEELAEPRAGLNPEPFVGGGARPLVVRRRGRAGGHQDHRDGQCITARAHQSAVGSLNLEGESL